MQSAIFTVLMQLLVGGINIHVIGLYNLFKIQIQLLYIFSIFMH